MHGVIVCDIVLVGINGITCGHMIGAIAPIM
jgi:hypothetical protein